MAIADISKTNSAETAKISPENHQKNGCLTQKAVAESFRAA